MPHLSISLLGSLQIALNGQPVTSLDYDKLRALFVYLVMEPTSTHRRESLAEMLWPDQPEQVGRDNLRQALSKLRQAIGDRESDPPFLFISRETLQFNGESNFTLDLDHFTELIDQSEQHSHAQIEVCTLCIQRLQEAIELYRGPFADRLTVRDGDFFEEWLSFRRDYFQSRALNALSVVTEHYLHHRSYDLARRYAWRQLELVPWHEPAYRQIMYLLALDGQRTAALAQYERCRRILEEELAIAPSVETTSLYEEIRVSEMVPAQSASVTLTPANELPTVSTPFIGRETELGTLMQRIADADCRLVTLVGPGGMGKTRLALEAARQSSNMFQRICYVPLASLDTPDLLDSAIADVLQFSTMNQDDFSTQLVNYLSDKQLLLILDNMDHLITGAPLLGQIVAHAPGVKLMVTSRERLNLNGEWVFNLKGLPIGGDDQGALQLFVQRAQMAQADFTFSVALSSPITRICQLVDGLPLGIELAAAWVHMLTCQEIADSIASNLAFLSTNQLGLPERQQSLRAVFEHSWELLSAEEQYVFGALAVFRGGFQADAALEVAGATLPLLLTLINKSMLHRNEQGRYEIHELLRQYALEKLAESQEAPGAYGRHLQFYVELVEASEPQLKGGQQIPWLTLLDAENDNLRTALDWSLTNDSVDIGLRLAASLWFFWHVRHYTVEGLAWLEKLLLAAPDDDSPAVRTKALFAAGWLAQNNRDLPRAQNLSETSLQLARQIEDKRSTAYPLSTLAWLAYFQGDYPQAATLGEESLALFREVNDQWGLVHTLNILGYIAESQGDYSHAELLHREGVIIARSAGDGDGLAWSSYLLGRVMAERGQYSPAIELCSQSLETYRELGNNWGAALVMYTLGDAFLALGNFSRAATLCEESVKLLREMSDFWAIGGPLSCLGLAAYRQADLMQANALSQESLIYFRQYGDKRGMAYALNTLGFIANRQGQYDRARDLFMESLRLRRDARIRRGMEVCFDQLAEIAVMQGHASHAARLFGAGESLRQTLGVSIAAPDADQYDAAITSLRKLLGDSAFNLAWAEGRTLPLDSMIATVLS